MIFTVFRKLYSKKSTTELAAVLNGQHLKIHHLEFEVYSKNDVFKVIPHAENDEAYTTIPIVRITLQEHKSGSVLKIVANPRRIDIGGPILILFFSCFCILFGSILLIAGYTEYRISSYIIMSIGLLVLLILYYRLQTGYYDYVRKILLFLKSKI